MLRQSVPGPSERSGRLLTNDIAEARFAYSDEGPEPSDATEQELLRCALAGDPDAYLHGLATASVLMPYDPYDPASSRGVTIVDQGRPYVAVITSPGAGQGLYRLAGQGRPVQWRTRVTTLDDVVRHASAHGVGVAVNPGTAFALHVMPHAPLPAPPVGPLPAPPVGPMAQAGYLTAGSGRGEGAAAGAAPASPARSRRGQALAVMVVGLLLTIVGVGSMVLAAVALKAGPVTCEGRVLRTGESCQTIDGSGGVKTETYEEASARQHRLVDDAKGFGAPLVLVGLGVLSAGVLWFRLASGTGSLPGGPGSSPPARWVRPRFNRDTGRSRRRQPFTDAAAGGDLGQKLAAGGRAGDLRRAGGGAGAGTGCP